LSVTRLPLLQYNHKVKKLNITITS